VSLVPKSQKMLQRCRYWWRWHARPLCDSWTSCYDDKKRGRAMLRVSL